MKTARYILRLSITLLLITAFVALALAGVNAITAPRIQQLNREKTQAAIQAVLPGGGEEMTLTGDTGIVKAAYVSSAGYAVQVEPAGFGGGISMMVGVDREGRVLGVSVITHAETPSLGAVAADSSAAGQAFREQYVGQTGPLAVTADGGKVEAITGATVTSRAVTEGVNAAIAFVKEVAQ